MHAAEASSKIVTVAQVLRRRAAWRRAGRTVVWTNGCFDLLHVGHVRALEAAAACGDVLVVGLNSDASVRRLKGTARPLVPQAERAEMLASLACVDAVCIYGADTPAAILKRLRPEIFCKGAQFAPPDIPEAAAVRAYGGTIRLTPMVPGHSTTEIVGRIHRSGRVIGHSSLVIGGERSHE